jgi:TRAP-type C4-dicarboxylate transport system permease small subunit
MKYDWQEYLGPRINAPLRWLADIAAFALIFLMSMVIADIVIRSFGFRSFDGLIEVASLTVLLCGFFGMGRCFAINEHIIIDLFTQNNKPRTNQIIDSIWLFIGVFFLLAVAYSMMLDGLEIHEAGERSQGWGWSPLIFVLPAVGGAIIAALVCLVASLNAFKLRWSKFYDID